MFKAGFVFVAAGLLAAQGAFAQGQAAPPSIALTKVLVTVPVGQRIGVLGRGVGALCPPTDTMSWDGSREVGTEALQTSFIDAVEKSGLKSADQQSNLFEAQASSEDFAVAAVIPAMKFNACMFTYNLGSAPYNGKGEMTVDWQVYSRLERKVVATIRTSAVHEQKAMTRDGTVALLHGAFGANANLLFANPDFKAAITKPAPTTASAPSSPEPLTLAIGPAGPMPISDATGSVVAILAGAGHGSGFLVSQDGHLLTNQHVVGDLKQVRVRWSDGLEAIAEVVRADRRRDVALLKVDSSRGRQPLKLRTTNLQPGEPVIAIGTPVDPQYQNSVTRGVLSGNRILDGFSYLQSDVAVSPGNSGGPLLDDQGTVVAITVLKDGRGENLNFFIPIRDALDFLGLKAG